MESSLGLVDAKNAPTAEAMGAVAMGASLLVHGDQNANYQAEDGPEGKPHEGVH